MRSQAGPVLILDTLRSHRRAMVLWVVGGSLAMVATALALRSELSRFEGGPQALAASVQAGAEAMRPLRWPAERLDTLGGYLTYHNVTLFTYFLSVYSAMRAVGAIRGAETAQALETILATGHARVAVVRDRAIGFGVVLLTIGVGVGVGLAVAMAVGSAPDTAGSVLTGVAGGLCAFVAYGLGTLVSQLVGTARSAAGVSVLIVTLLYVSTNLGDRIGPLGLLRFVSPFHYFGESRALVPGHGFSVAAALVSMGLATALLVAAAQAFQRRDIGAPLWFRRSPGTRRTGRVRRPQLRSVSSATLWREWPGLVVWFVAVATWMGLMAWMEPSVIEAWDKFDFAENLDVIDPRSTATDQYLSFAGEVLAPIVAAFVITQAAGWVGDLQQGRVEMILSTPLSRAGLVGQQMIALLAGAAVVVAGACAGLVLGAAAVRVNVSGSGVLRLSATVYLLAAGLGGAAALLVAWLRTGAAVAALAVLAGASYLFVLLVGLFGWPQWLARMSIFGAIGHPYLRSPPIGGVAFLVALAVVGTTAAAAVATRASQIR